MLEEILRYFPRNVALRLKQSIKDEDFIEEIRIRQNNPIILKFCNKEEIINYCIVTEEIMQIMQYLCDNSIYSYQNQICSGYITIKGGHRVGVTGSVVIQDNKIININYISSLNFRVAKQIKGASNYVLKYVLNIENNSVYNTLIVSPPGGGKTTLLRDLIRQVSNGIEEIKFNGITVGIVDERGEIAAMHKGTAQNEIGIRTDVLDNVPKSIGMKMLIRSMSPKVISADEIGNSQDVDAINYATCCGVKGIFTAHGNSIEDIKLNPELKKLISQNIFERIIFLEQKEKGKIREVYKFNKDKKEYENIVINGQYV